MIHRDRITSRTRERERDQTHSYWYIPSAPRVNYSLLVMESAGMMNMATGEGFHLRQGAGTGSRLVFGGYRGLWLGTPDLFYSPMFLGHMDIYRRKKSVGGATRGPRGWRARPGGWAPPLPRGLLEASLTWTPSLWASSDPKISSMKFQVNWTPFGFSFLQNPKTR